MNIKLAGPFLNRANKHIAADVGMVNSVLSIMKGKKKELIFLGTPAMGQVLC